MQPTNPRPEPLALRIALLLAAATLAGQRNAYTAKPTPPPSLRRGPFARLLARHTQGGR